MEIISSIIGNFSRHSADNYSDMAGPHPTRAPAKPHTEASVAPAQKKDDPNQIIHLAAAPTPEENRPWINPYFPRFGSAWQHSYFVRMIADAFVEKKDGEATILMMKAWNHFIQAALGLGGVPRPRVDIAEVQGDAPDIAERLSKTQASGANWDDHYKLVADQMQKSAASTYPS